jgi:hypothetical protein
MKFGDGLRRRHNMGSERTVNEALRQTLELEVVQLAVGFSTRFRKRVDRAFRRSRPSPKWKQRLQTAHVLAPVRAPGTFEISVPKDRKTITNETTCAIVIY